MGSNERRLMGCAAIPVGRNKTEYICFITDNMKRSVYFGQLTAFSHQISRRFLYCSVIITVSSGIEYEVKGELG